MNNRLQFFITLILLGLTFIYLRFISGVEAVSLNRSLKEFPTNIAEWKGIDTPMDEGTLNILKVDDYIMRVYQDDKGFPIWLYIGYFERQTEGQIIHSPKHCYPGGGWFPIETEVHKIFIPDIGREIKVNRYFIAKGNERQMILYWYQSRGRIVTSEYLDRLYLIWDSIFRKRSDGALIRISAPVDSSKEKTLKKEIAFVKYIFPELISFLPN